jgi:hypothetical protein
MRISPASDSVSRWLLIGLQVFLVVMWLPFEHFRRESLQRFHHHTLTEDLCCVAFLTVMFALIVLGLFYFRSQRGLAIRGLVLGFGALVYCIFLPGYH